MNRKHLLLISSVVISLFFLTPLKISAAGGCQIDACKIESLKLLGNAHEMKELLVSLCTDNAPFVKALSKIVDDINNRRVSSEDHLKLRVVNLRDEATRCKLWDNDGSGGMSVCAPDPELISGEDRWMRDFCKVATAKIVGESKEKTLIVDVNRGRETVCLPAKLAKHWNNAYVVNTGTSGICGDYGGNIDVTPNDILYTGSNTSPELLQFWKDKGYKDRVVTLDTEWLRVGHVDEHVTTVTVPNDPCGIAILKADPMAAMQTILKNDQKSLKDFPSEVNMLSMKETFSAFHAYLRTNQAKIHKRPSISSSSLSLPWPFSISVHLPWSHASDGEGTRMSRTRLTLPGSAEVEGNEQMYSLLKSQFATSAIIEQNVELLKSEIVKKTPACKEMKVIAIPVLFKCQGMNFDFDSNPSECDALLPDSVNLTVVGADLIIPDPLYTPFRKQIQSELTQIQKRAHFIEDVNYHNLKGEVHCGTNELRVQQVQ
ncbi:MAG: hypothetical protein HQK50_08870 [Oligoflexia bacterium]|nr:hypothetical protein [Oligoflexia bacterium]MBF0365671.1 hypothetical protein [Oligoflexia bacterium]